MSTGGGDFKPRYSAPQLGKEWGMSDDAVIRLLREEGIFPRTGKRGKRKWIWTEDIRNGSRSIWGWWVNRSKDKAHDAELSEIARGAA